MCFFIRAFPFLLLFLFVLKEQERSGFPPFHSFASASEHALRRAATILNAKKMRLNTDVILCIS